MTETTTNQTQPVVATGTVLEVATLVVLRSINNKLTFFMWLAIIAIFLSIFSAILHA